VAFRGIFVGVDRYASPDIGWLSCARRDAVALDALFRDTLGEGGLLLVDEAATTQNIQSALSDLTGCDPDDVVVLYFSGHGAPSHHLIGHDTDPYDLDRTGLALDDLTERFTAIPARRLLCILDCCFSGGMGAKVLMPDVRARGTLGSTEESLAKMSGQGRVVLTASSASQEAWENASLGHGFLTYHLIDALLGAGGAHEGSTLRLLGVLDHVTQAVVQAAEGIGREQHPSIRGTLEGDVVWPVFRRGANYAAAFPNWAETKALPDIRSLENLGFPPELVDAWAGSIPTLNALQLAAINDHGVLAGGNLLVSAPTSSGKTMVGELAALKAAVERKRSIFLLPMRALVNDKFAAFTRTYAPFGIRTIRATGEIEDDIPDLLEGRFDICLMTNEKFAALALARPHLLDMVSLVVVDEAQLIADPSRGVTLEFLLTMLKVRTAGKMPQVVLLSAVIGDSNGLDRWLDASLLVRTDRPVPLEEGVLRPNGDFRFLDNAKVEREEPTFIRPNFGRGTAQACARRIQLASHAGSRRCSPTCRRLSTSTERCSTGSLMARARCLERLRASTSSLGLGVAPSPASAHSPMELGRPSRHGSRTFVSTALTRQPRRRRRPGARSTIAPRRTPGRPPGRPRRSGRRSLLRLGGQGSRRCPVDQRAACVGHKLAPHHRPRGVERVLRSDVRLAARGVRRVRQPSDAVATARLRGRTAPAAGAARCRRRHDANRRPVVCWQGIRPLERRLLLRGCRCNRRSHRAPGRQSHRATVRQPRIQERGPGGPAGGDLLGQPADWRSGQCLTPSNWRRSQPSSSSSGGSPTACGSNRAHAGCARISEERRSPTARGRCWCSNRVGPRFRRHPDSVERHAPQREPRCHEEPPYGQEFWAEAVRLTRPPGTPATSVARDLESRTRASAAIFARRPSMPASRPDERAELTRLRRQNRTLRIKSEILKRAAVFFAAETDETA
jgi:transposase-like protein